MEQRKLIKLGNSSFAIALPKDWVDKSGLKKGENVFLEQNGNGEITLWSKPKVISDDRILEINASGKNAQAIKKEIISAYTNGSNVIAINGSIEKKEVKELKTFVKDLMSFEVIEESPGRIVIKDLLNMEEININSFIKRIDNNIKEMFSVISRGLEKGSLTKKDSEEMEEVDRDTTKFWFLISRLFFKGIDNPSIMTLLKRDGLEFFSEWWLAYNLEHIGDQIKEISKLLSTSEVEKADRKALSELFSSITDIYHTSIQSFNKKDKNLAIETAIKGKEIQKECDQLNQSKSPVVSKLALFFKELETNSYQNLKNVMYSKIK